MFTMQDQNQERKGSGSQKTRKRKNFKENRAVSINEVSSGRSSWEILMAFAQSRDVNRSQQLK